MLTEPWRVRLLGGFEIRSGAIVHTRCRTARMEVILAYLAWNLGRPCSREELADKLWGDRDIQKAQTNVRVAINGIRSQLEPQGVPFASVLMNHSRAAVMLNPELVTCDVVEFRELIQKRPHTSPEERRHKLTAAVGLYLGELMPGHYDDVIDSERNNLSLEFMDALQELSNLVKQSGDLDEAIQVCRRLTLADPYDEDAHSELIKLLTMAGRSDEAINHYQAVEKLFMENGLDAPSVAAASLRSARGQTSLNGPRETQDRLRRPDAAAPPSTPRRPDETSSQPSNPWMEDADTSDWRGVPDVPYRTDGAQQAPVEERWTEDPLPDSGAQYRMPEIEHTPRRSPLPPAPSRPAPPPVRLIPLQMTRFFGREEELAQIRSFIDNGERLLTLIGPGGAGKTRISVEFANALARDTDWCVAFIPLADVTSSGDILPTIASTLRIDIPEHGDIRTKVEAHLSGRPWLLILDNLEQLSADGRQVFLDLLQSIEQLHILATTRHALDVVGEQCYAIDPLPVPMQAGTPERLLEFACVQLFMDRASKIVPGFRMTNSTATHIAEVCRGLEGLPLAIELAAGLAGDLAPKQIVARLSDRFTLLVSRRTGLPARQASLLASLEWSYRLIPPDLQRTFAALSIFRGGWTLEALEAVCDTNQGLRSIAELRRRSLITVDHSGDEVRYGMLEILRAFAAEKLTPGDRPFLAARHAQVYSRLASEAAAGRRSDSQTRWLEQLAIEHQNLIGALLWSIENEPARAVRMVEDLGLYWAIRGHRAVARTWISDAAQAARRMGDQRGEAECVTVNSVLALSDGDLPDALAQASRSVELWQALDIAEGRSRALGNLGRVYLAAGRVDEAYAAYQESLAIAEAIGDEICISTSLANIAGIYLHRGDVAASRTMALRALPIIEARGDIWTAAVVRSTLGDIACEAYEPREAMEQYARAIEGFALTGDLYHGSGVLRQSAAVLAYLGAHREGATLAGAARAAEERSGRGMEAGAAEDFADTISGLQASLPPDVFDAAWADGASMDLNAAAAALARYARS